MKQLLLLGLLGWFQLGFGQVAIPDDRAYTFSHDQEHYYFLWDSKTEQSLDFDTITYRTKCSVHILNNTEDTLLFHRVGRRNAPLYWFVKGSERDWILPGDTIHLYAKFSPRHGTFYRSVEISYHFNSSDERKFFRINASGYFIDERVLERMNDSNSGTTPTTASKKLPPTSNQQSEQNSKQPLTSQSNNHPKHDSIPVKVMYYGDGVVASKTYKREGIVKESFNMEGILSTVDYSDGSQIQYYPNQTIKKRKNPNAPEGSPIEISYYPNGCVCEERFKNSLIIKQYEKSPCGVLSKYQEMTNTRTTETTVIHYSNAKIDSIVYHRAKTGTQRVVHIGTFQNNRLMQGIATFYGDKNQIIYRSHVLNGERDGILSAGEKQGKQINLRDEMGRKTGLWITQNKNHRLPIEIDDLTKSISNYRGFSGINYIYEHGDTVSSIGFYDDGAIESISWISDKQKRIRNHQPVGERYFENGFIQYRSYQLETGKDVTVHYSEENENQIIGGNCDGGEMTFENGRLVEIHSQEWRARGVGINHTVHPHEVVWSCKAKGQFKHFELYNGYYYYFNDKGERTLTEKVVNGVIQYNPRVKLTSETLEKAALRHDLNFNHRTEQRELNEITNIRLTLDSAGIENFPFYELYKFRNLELLDVNNLRYDLSKYPNRTVLKKAIQNKEGHSTSRNRSHGWIEPPPPPPFPGPLPPPQEPCEFPEVEAEFPGGHTALFKYIQDNLVYPDVATELKHQGKVYVSFIVEEDGSVTNVKIMRGISKEFDLEAKRVVRSMPKWTPAQCNGKISRSRMQLPVQFTLQ